jgi:hypothetical protein
MQYGIWNQFELCAGVQGKAVADTLSTIFLYQLSHFHLILQFSFLIKNGFRNRVATGQYTLEKSVEFGTGSELGGVRVWRAGLFFIHTLELRFKRQIFMIFIVD